LGSVVVGVETPLASRQWTQGLKTTITTRLTAAMFSGFGQRLRDGYIAQATRLRIGNIDIVNLPGEPFVEFQLFAQQVAAKNSFTCVAGYGECGVWYYGPDSIFTDRGGCEQTWSLTGPCQRKVEAALTTLLVRPVSTKYTPSGQE